MSMLENLAFIKEQGETAFLQQQEDKYTCLDSGLSLAGMIYTTIEHTLVYNRNFTFSSSIVRYSLRLASAFTLSVKFYFFLFFHNCHELIIFCHNT